MSEGNFNDLAIVLNIVLSLRRIVIDLHGWNFPGVFLCLPRSILRNKINGLLSTSVPLTLGNVDRHSLSFLRAHLEGVSLEALVLRYGDSEILGNTRQARARLTTIRQELSAHAKRHGRTWRDVRLLWVDPERLSSRSPEVSLDEFRFEHDPDGFYTESELIELYSNEYQSDRIDRRIRSRNERIRHRQLTFLAWLEQQLPKPPSGADQLSMWLDLQLAARFQEIRVVTVDDLLSYIARQGTRWWLPIARLGIVGARRLETWLATFQAEIERGPLDQHELWRKRELNSPSVSPLEYFSPAKELETNRELILLWLSERERHVSANSYRVYRREAERLVLFWCLELKRPISLLWPDSLARYKLFLSLVGGGASTSWPFILDEKIWIGPRHAERTTLAWRPFAGPLMPSSQRLALDVVRSIYSSVNAVILPVRSHL